MAKLEVKNLEGAIVKELDLADEVFTVPPNQSLLWEAVKSYLASQRRGTHSTKTRGEVSGGGRKPWRQKGTGRARAGSNRSPLWRHGGTCFGPMPRDYSYSLPKKAKRAALVDAIASKVAENKLIVIDNLNLAEPKTKLMSALLENLGVQENALVLIKDENRNLTLAARNIPTVKVLRMGNINVYDVLKYRYLLATQDALTVMQEVYGK
jgi:large subunit ribosomal protein L4